MKKKQSLQEPSAIPSEEPTQVPTVITESVQSISTSDHHLNPLDGNKLYYEVINCIEVMDDTTQGVFTKVSSSRNKADRRRHNAAKKATTTTVSAGAAAGAGAAVGAKPDLKRKRGNTSDLDQGQSKGEP